MMKKIKRWYSNLTVYEKERLFLTLFVILYYILMITLDLLGFFGSSCYAYFSLSGSIKLCLFGLFADCLLVFIWFPALIINIVASNIDDRELTDKLTTKLEKAEKEVREYFKKSGKNVLEIVPKSSKGISDVIDYYHRNGKLVESYWAELDEVNDKAVLYISAIYVGETDRHVYPDTITNFGYLLGNFTFKD